LSKKSKSKRAKSSEKAPATGLAEALNTAGIKAQADDLIAEIEPDAVPEVEATEPEVAPVETAEPEAAATTGASESATETTTAPELTPEQLEAITAAEAKVETAKAEYAKARAELSALKKGPKGDAVDAEGKPLSAGKRAWNTRLARGFQPKEKKAKAPIDPNAPNLTAGQKAALTRAARKADPNYQPPQKAAAKAPAKDRLDAAVGAAFPVEQIPTAAAPVEAVA
jgi:ribonuclease E